MATCRYKLGKCCLDVRAEVKRPKSCTEACKERKDPITNEPLVPLVTGEYKGKGGGSYQLCAVFIKGTRAGYMNDEAFPGKGCTYGYGNVANEAEIYDCYCMSQSSCTEGSSPPIQFITRKESNNGSYNCQEYCKDQTVEPLKNGRVLALNDEAQVCTTDEGNLGFRPGTTWPDWHSGHCIAVDASNRSEILTQTEDWRCLCTFEEPEEQSEPVSAFPTQNNNIPTSPKPSSDGLSTGAIVGIAIGAIALLGMLVMIFLIKRRKNSTEGESQHLQRKDVYSMDRNSGELGLTHGYMEVAEVQIPAAAAQPIYTAEALSVHEASTAPNAIPVSGGTNVVTAGPGSLSPQHDAPYPGPRKNKNVMREARREGLVESDSDSEDREVERAL